MAKKIKDLTLEEICSKYGILTRRSDIYVVLDKSNLNPSRIQEFLEEFYPLDKFSQGITYINDGQGVSTEANYDAIINILGKYQDIFDKEIYAYKIYKELIKENSYVDLYGTSLSLSDAIGKSKSSIASVIFKDRYTRAIDNELKMLLKGVEVVDDLEDIYFNAETNEATIKTSQDYTGNSKTSRDKEREAIKKFKEIEKRIDFENLAYLVTPLDFMNIFRCKGLGYVLREKLAEMGNGKIKENICTVLEANKKYIDTDKLLLVALERYYTAVEKSKDSINYVEILELKDFSRNVEALLVDKHITLERNKTGKPETISFDETKSNIETLTSSYIKGKFCAPKEIVQMREKILNGEVPYNSILLLDYANSMKFSIDELFQIVSHTPDALQYFLQNGMFEPKKLSKYLEDKQNYSQNELLALYSNGVINNDEILNLYKSSKISIENIKLLKNSIENPEELENMVSVEEFMNLYTDSEKKEEFEKYRKVFKTLKIDGKSIEEKNDLGIEILDFSSDLLEEESLSELYHMGILSCDLFVDFVGNSALLELYSRGELKPLDARRLFDDGVITKKMLCDILSNPRLPSEKKLALIFSTFPKTQEDLPIREELLPYLGKTINSMYNTTKTNNLVYKGSDESNDENINENNDESSETKNTYITDPCARWNLIAKLDEDYSQDMLKDGTIVFYLPNKEKYVIEKLFKAEQKPAYGAATYILDEDTFNKYKSAIIQDERINRSNLVKLNASSAVKKIIHKGWGNAICKVFDVQNSTLYTKEQQEEIVKLSREVEESKKIREK